MSEVLARIRVRETAGIRRFLYPLTTYINLSEGIELTTLSLATEQQEAVPLQVVQAEDTLHRLDFAISLAPNAKQELWLTKQGQHAPVSDPLRLELATEKVFFWNNQQKFTIAIRHDALHRDVVYDGVFHPRDLPTITCNGHSMNLKGTPLHTPIETAKLSAWVIANGKYPDGRSAKTHTEITAVKSWENITHRLDNPKPNDVILFTLSLSVTSPTLTYDFGIGGGVYGKLNADAAPEVIWRTEFSEAPYALWSVETAGRADYVGEVKTAEAFLPLRWFHLIDSDKALAVAITRLPSDCRELTVKLTHEGDVTIAFRLGETITGPEEFGVCYHFLNDVPAIAAATNPQSILLPPIVEVLPL